MNASEHVKKAEEWARRAPTYRAEEYTPADVYARANYHLLLAITETLNLREGA